VRREYSVIVIGGGHAGVEAAWAAANVLGGERTVALITMDPTKIGVMSCNPAIGGLAKGQMVREIDALNGVMGLATDAAGIQFKMLNTSKGAAVHGPRAQCDKHAYAECVQGLIAGRREIEVIAGSVEGIFKWPNGQMAKGPNGGGAGLEVRVARHARGGEGSDLAIWPFDHLALYAPAIVLTTGTFMRGLMHTGEAKTAGGRFGEGAAEGISGALRGLGFELGRLKTGTPPRLKRSSIRWDELEEQRGDERPTPFSALSVPVRGSGVSVGVERARSASEGGLPLAGASGSFKAGTLAGASGSFGAGGLWSQVFPRLPQVDCRVTRTTGEIHELIRANLHRAPMYSGQIESVGPRYCPSLEDKVVRFAVRESHHVYLEPESLRPGHSEWIYCNGISTSLPADVQEGIVRGLPGCEGAEILRLGYAVEYDMVKPHQILATGETRLVPGLFLAGQINGTSGYEEAASQGLIAGLNAARRALGREAVVLGRDEAYAGVLMDDLVTKTPVEPYRMFTSRAEHRLLLRADNAEDRLMPRAEAWGLLNDGVYGPSRRGLFARRRAALDGVNAVIDATMLHGKPLGEILRRPEFGEEQLAAVLSERGVDVAGLPAGVLRTAHTERFYEHYVRRARTEIRRQGELERRRLPADADYLGMVHLRTEARQALDRFRPATFGQASRLEGMTPADVTLLGVLVRGGRGG
jgi:tRNA uridine 5-carboxymethylaminomethyl modification enzyme